MKPSTNGPSPAASSAAASASVKRAAAPRPLSAEERRRAQRVLLRMPVFVHISGKAQTVHASTHTVSENGALLVLAEPLAEGTKVVIENPKTQKHVEAKVARPPQVTSEGALVPVEFLTASPSFWNIFFPPIVN